MMRSEGEGRGGKGTGRQRREGEGRRGEAGSNATTMDRAFGWAGVFEVVNAVHGASSTCLWLTPLLPVHWTVQATANSVRPTILPAPHQVANNSRRYQTRSPLALSPAGVAQHVHTPRGRGRRSAAAARTPAPAARADRYHGLRQPRTVPNAARPHRTHGPGPVGLHTPVLQLLPRV